MVAAPQNLASLGWDDSWAEAAAAYAPVGPPGRVTRVDRGVSTVLTDDGVVRASLGGSVLDAGAAEPTALPCTGDWVVVRAWSDGPTTIEVVLPRRTAVVRAEASGSSRGQILVANADQVAAVVALHPEPNLARLERLVAIGVASGATPLVVLTKADRVGDAPDLAAEVAELVPDIAVHVVSVKTGLGLDELRQLLGVGRTLALVGASGHGKSSLANALIGTDVIRTRAIREDGKGRHTSVRRELVMVPGGGSVVDTPGLRGVGLQGLDAGIDAVFPDIASLAEHCHFRDCAHLEEPGCAVLAAVDDGVLSVRRLERWRSLSAEAAQMHGRAADRRTAGQRRKFASKQENAQIRALKREGWS